jgi:hypothetical protein
MNPANPQMGHSGRDEALTPSDLVTPHDGDVHHRAPDAEPDRAPGIVDPRDLPVPEILQPPPPGLAPPG